MKTRFWPLILAMTVPQLAQAATVWTGTDLSFTKDSFADWTQEANQDRITADTWLTRQDTMGWFNIRTEASYDFQTGQAPANTEWAYDLAGNGNDGQLISAANFANLTFEAWKNAVNFFPPGAVDLPAVLHLISEDIYLDITVTAWGGPDGGSFSYTRAAAPVPEPSTGVLLVLGFTGFALTGRRGAL